MTREELEKEYNLRPDGTISNPGKFVGEKLYIPYFWAQECDETEWDDELEITKYLFHPNGEDEINFPELKKVRSITLWEDEQGFVQSLEILKSGDRQIEFK